MNDTLKQLELKAESFGNDINNIANLVSFNEITAQFINAKDIDERLKLYRREDFLILNELKKVYKDGGIRKAREMLESYPDIVQIRIRIDDSGVGGGVTDRLNEIVAERIAL